MMQSVYRDRNGRNKVLLTLSTAYLRELPVRGKSYERIATLPSTRMLKCRSSGSGVDIVNGLSRFRGFGAMTVESEGL
jgi:hypothetical protein